MASFAANGSTCIISGATGFVTVVVITASVLVITVAVVVSEFSVLFSFARQRTKSSWTSLINILVIYELLLLLLCFQLV